jgi:hypothetical protein
MVGQANPLVGFAVLPGSCYQPSASFNNAGENSRVVAARLPFAGCPWATETHAFSLLDI